MEIEKRQGEIGKKLWNVVRIVLYITKKSIGKSSKIILELQMLLKRGEIAAKAMSNLTAALHHHHHRYYSALTCRSDEANASFISPRHYEFSCTNTPLFNSKRKNRHHHYGGPSAAEELKVMHKVFDMLGRYDASSTEALSPLPGFGPSAAVRQLRVTDSPYGAAEVHGGDTVDMGAEEFIAKFYKDLKNQKRTAALESPSRYHMWAR